MASKHHKRINQRIAKLAAQRERAFRSGNTKQVERIEEQLDKLEHKLLMWDRRDERREVFEYSMARFA